jgi:hypothetical protein
MIIILIRIIIITIIITIIIIIIIIIITMIIIMIIAILVPTRATKPEVLDRVHACPCPWHVGLRCGLAVDACGHAVARRLPLGL